MSNQLECGSRPQPSPVGTHGHIIIDSDMVERSPADLLSALLGAAGFNARCSVIPSGIAEQTLTDKPPFKRYILV